VRKSKESLEKEDDKNPNNLDKIDDLEISVVPLDEASPAQIDEFNEKLKRGDFVLLTSPRGFDHEMFEEDEEE
jgi:hypothetical protein